MKKIQAAAIGFASIESLPAFHYKPGSAATRVVAEGLENPPFRCSHAPVCEHIVPSAALDLASVPVERLAAQASRWRTDTLFIEGPEPLASLDSEVLEALASELRRRGISLGIRFLGLVDPEPLTGIVDLVVVEYLARYASRPVDTVELLDNIERVFDTGAWVEVSAHVPTPYTDHIAPLLPILESTRAPLHVYPETHAGGAALTRMKEALEKRLDYVYIHNKPYEYLDTYCPRCGAPIAVRDEGVLRVLELRGDGSCWKCGATVRFVGPVNNRTPERVVLLARGGVAWYPASSVARAA